MYRLFHKRGYSMMISEFVDVLHKFFWSHRMIHFSFFVLISIQSVSFRVELFAIIDATKDIFKQLAKNSKVQMEPFTSMNGIKTVWARDGMQRQLWVSAFNVINFV